MDLLKMANTCEKSLSPEVDTGGPVRAERRADAHRPNSLTLSVEGYTVG